VLCAQL